MVVVKLMCCTNVFFFSYYNQESTAVRSLDSIFGINLLFDVFIIK